MSFWDPQFLIYVGLTCATVLIALIILAITTRRVNFLLSEVQSIRRELGLLDDAVQTLGRSLGQSVKDQADEGK